MGGLLGLSAWLVLWPGISNDHSPLRAPGSTSHLGSGVKRIDPIRFMAGCRKRRI